MNIAKQIAARFGGARALARIIDIPATTVQSWCDRGLIPAQHQANVLAAAKRAAVPLSPADFFPSEAAE